MTQGIDSRLKHLFVKDGKLHPFWRCFLYVPIWLLAALFGQSLALLLYAFRLAASNPDPAAIARTVSDMAGWPVRVGIGVFLGQLLLLLLVTYLFVRFLDRRSFSSFGFNFSPGWLEEVGFGFALGMGMIGAIFIVEWAIGVLTLEGVRSAAELGTARGLFVLGFFFLFVLQGTGEELPMRGYLLQAIEQWLGPVGATLVTALGFSLLHIFNFLYVAFNPLAMINLALFGVVTAYAYFVTRRLWLPAALHAAWNFALGPIASLPVSGLTYRGLLHTTVMDRGRIFTGADFGPEGGMLATLAMLIGWAIIWLWARRRTPAPDITS